MLVANPKHLHSWGLTTARSRFDYDSPDHILSEMMHEHYWSSVLEQVQVGDVIHVMASDAEQAVVRIDWKDTRARTVGMSLIERLTERPIPTSTGYTLKWRGPRGGFYCVVNDAGDILARDLKTMDDARRKMDSMTERAA